MVHTTEIGRDGKPQVKRAPIKRLFTKMTDDCPSGHGDTVSRMTSLVSQPPRLSLPRIDTGVLVPIALVCAAFVMRWPFLGHPMIHVDEQFYLLAGQRITEGWLPYVDFWDRKPVGLFLIYSAIRLLGGDGVNQYQSVATLFVAGTAYIIYLIARRGVASPSAFAAALIYCALLAPINGAGGQSPVFYNIFMAKSALLVLRASETRDWAVYRRNGLAAMLCAGLALQLKYMAVVEGVFFGLWLMWASRLHLSAISALRVAGMFAATALLPTLAAAAWFAAAGALEPFLHANFVSIFQRAAAPDGFERDTFAHTMRMLLFAFACAAGALGVMSLRAESKDRLFLALWSAFAVAGFLAIGNYFDHYAIPLLVPLSVLLSRLFAVRLLGPLLFALLFLQATVYGQLRYSPKAASQDITAAMTATIAPVVAKGQCLFVADTPMVLYLTSKACGPWRYSFPFHLIDATEAGTGDDDQPSAIHAILAARPGSIVTGSPHFPPTVQLGNVALLMSRLESDYVVAGRYPDRDRVYTVWIRRDLTGKPRTVASPRNGVPL